MKFRPLCLLLVYGCLLAGCGKYDISVPKKYDALPDIKDGRKILVNKVPLMVELAMTDEQRRKGLMFRREMDEYAGMLFVYPRADLRSFWMKNTFLPLSIAYISADGKILQIEDLEPHNETGVPSVDKAKYALEVNQGWFEKHGVRVGQRVENITDLTGE